MQQLDEEQHHIQKDCEYKIINGQSWNLTRQPSILKLKDSSLYKRHHSANSSFSSDEGSRPGSRVDNQILKWNEDDILAWLKEIGFECYEVITTLTTPNHTKLSWHVFRDIHNMTIPSIVCMPPIHICADHVQRSCHQMWEESGGFARRASERNGSS